MMFTSTGRAMIAATCIAGLCMALAAPAGAEGSGQYPSDPAARTFTGGTAGWTSSTSFDGACIPPALCASASNAYVASGDAEGNGYISSSYSGAVGAGGVGGTTTAVWESPAFSYQTIAGQPEAASFSMSRRADVGQLLAVAGDSAEYSVQLLDLSEGGSPLSLIAPTTLAGAQSWTAVPDAKIGASRLRPGDRYQIRIESTYTSGTSALVTGSADYDNVDLRTAASEGAGDNGGGNGRGGGNGNGSGERSALRSGELLSLYSSGLSKTASLEVSGGKGKRVLVRISCPKKIGGACRVTAQGLLGRRRPATAKSTVKVGSGKSRRIALRVKPRLRATVAKRKRLLVSEKVRVGRTTATAYRVRKLIRR